MRQMEAIDSKSKICLFPFKSIQERGGQTYWQIMDVYIYEFYQSGSWKQKHFYFITHKNFEQEGHKDNLPLQNSLSRNWWNISSANILSFSRPDPKVHLLFSSSSNISNRSEEVKSTQVPLTEIKGHRFLW